MRSIRETYGKDEGQRINAENQDMLLVMNQIQENLKQSSQAEIRELQVN